MKSPLQRLGHSPAEWRAYAHDFDELMREVGPHHAMFAEMAGLRNLALDVANALELEAPQPREWR